MYLLMNLDSKPKTSRYKGKFILSQNHTMKLEVLSIQLERMPNYLQEGAQMLSKTLYSGKNTNTTGAQMLSKTLSSGMGSMWLARMCNFLL